MAGALLLRRSTSLRGVERRMQMSKEWLDEPAAFQVLFAITNLP
jgi:hypothetical protein